MQCTIVINIGYQCCTTMYKRSTARVKCVTVRHGRSYVHTDARCPMMTDKAWCPPPFGRDDTDAGRAGCIPRARFIFGRPWLNIVVPNFWPARRMNIFRNAIFPRPSNGAVIVSALPATRVQAATETTTARGHGFT